MSKIFHVGVLAEHSRMPLVTTNTDLVPFDISECWYLILFRPTYEDLHVFQSDPYKCFQKTQEDLDFRKILFFHRAVAAERYGMRF